ncbi:MAG: carboxypeptidase regulatory-like domain-containing protein [Acidobacteriota bacterium]
MKHFVRSLVFALLLIAATSSLGFAQAGQSSALTGTVVDQSGGVIPGAEVVVKNDNTGAEYKAVTAENGTFSIPALNAGTYTATVSVPNFKQSITKNIVLVVGVPSNVKIVLQVGGSTETVTVTAGAEVIQTSSATISTTLSTTQMAQLPLATRNALDFLVFLPGVNTTGSSRNATFMGMPNSTTHITVDGVPTQDQNYMGQYGTDGFYSFITPRPDSIQEVTVSTAASGADSTGAGAVQIRFVTRSGNNDYHGSLYDYERNTALNSNYWFTNRDSAPVYWGDPGKGLKCTPQQLATEWDKCKAARSRFILHQAGGRIGGPISIPWLFSGKDRAFFFLNLETFQLPNSSIRTNTIYSPAMEQGIYSYVYKQTGQPDQVKTANLFTIAQAAGQTSTMDPTVQKLIADIRSSTATTGAIQSYPTQADPNYQNYIWQSKGLETRNYMTTRFDFNLTTRHRVELSWNGEVRTRNPDYLNSRGWRYPGFPSYGRVDQQRGSFSYALRSTISSRLVNEARGGILLGTVLFNPNASPGDFSGTSQGIGNLGGYSWTPSGITGIIAVTQPSRRNGPVKSVDDTLTWTKGSHSMSFGGSFMHVGSWEWWQTLAPSINFGLNSTYDPAYAAMVATANYPNATTTQATTAGTLYASLTARVTSIGASAVINENTNKYTYNGPYTERGRQREMGIFAQDSWRMFPNFTLTYGLRWEVQFPWTPLNNGFSWASTAEAWGPSGINNLFKPGASGGKATLLYKFDPGTHAYNVDYKSFAPSVGFAWSPKTKGGILGKILGESSQTVIRSGFAIAYNRMGMFDYEDYLFAANPGGTIDATRNQTIGNLVSGTGTDVYPLLFRDRSRLGAPPFAASPNFPLKPAITDSINTIEPDISTPYTMSWTFGLQREISKDMAIEVRYAATRNLQTYFQRNLNEYNIVENGWLNEFRLAQQNLNANIAAGKGKTFRYDASVPGTSPLPITLAYLGGKLDPTVSNNYTSAVLGSSQASFFTNTTYVNSYLNSHSPSPSSLAQVLYSSDATRRANALAAGLPANEFIVNPDVLSGGAYIYKNGGGNYYDSMVVELRRRLSKGLLVQANYTWAKALTLALSSWRQPWHKNLGDTLPQTFKVNWVYELPIGSGRSLMSGVGKHIDRVVGGWELQGTARIQSGNLLDFGNVALVGMTDQQLRDAVGLRFDDAKKIVYYLPQDIIDQSFKAYNFDSSGYTNGTPTGRYLAPAGSAGAGNCVQIVAGDCAPLHHYVRGPSFTRFDLSLVKRIRFTETKDFELRAEFLNAFNNINFYGSTSNCASATNLTCAQVTSAYTDASNQQDPGGRLIQIVMRINF